MSDFRPIHEYLWELWPQPAKTAEPEEIPEPTGVEWPRWVVLPVCTVILCLPVLSALGAPHLRVAIYNHSTGQSNPVVQPWLELAWALIPTLLILFVCTMPASRGLTTPTERTWGAIAMATLFLVPYFLILFPVCAIWGETRHSDPALESNIFRAFHENDHTFAYWGALLLSVSVNFIPFGAILIKPQEEAPVQRSKRRLVNGSEFLSAEELLELSKRSCMDVLLRNTVEGSST